MRSLRNCDPAVSQCVLAFVYFGILLLGLCRLMPFHILLAKMRQIVKEDEIFAITCRHGVGDIKAISMLLEK